MGQFVGRSFHGCFFPEHDDPGTWHGAMAQGNMGHLVRYDGTRQHLVATNA